MSTYAVPLQLSDANGGGVELNSDGALAMRVFNLSATANFVTVNASPSGTFSGSPGVRIGAANTGASGNVALVLQGQGNGPVFVSSALDIASAITIDLPVDSSGITAGLLTTMTSTGTVKTAGLAGLGAVVGVALATATTGSAPIAYGGKVACTFDNPATPGHFVTTSSSSQGQCHDNGSSFSNTVQTIGMVIDTSGNVLLRR